jgi:hypothetical protein
VRLGAAGPPLRHVAKLAVNPLARTVGLGCGWGLVIAAADNIAHGALGLDELLPRVAAVLRREAVRYAERVAEHPAAFADIAYVVAGFSQKFGRLAAYLLVPAT